MANADANRNPEQAQQTSNPRALKFGLARHSTASYVPFHWMTEPAVIGLHPLTNFQPKSFFALVFVTNRILSLSE